MKKKYNIFLITIVSVFVLALLTIVLSTSNLFKIKADINDAVSSDVGHIDIICDKTTLSVNGETNCTIKGYLNDRISSVSGKITSSSNLQITEIQKMGDWQGTSGDEIISYYGTLMDPGDFDIATFKVKALENGAGTISLTSYTDSDDEIVEVNIGDSNFQTVQVSEPIVNFTVSESSTISSENNLSYLSVDPGVLSPAFDENINSYYVMVENIIDSVNITANAKDLRATVTGTGLINLPEGVITSVPITVTATDGSSNIYEVEIYRQTEEDASKSSDNTLKNLSVEGATLTPNFESNIIEYSTTVDSSKIKVNITAETNDVDARVSGAGQVDLKQGDNIVPIIVTAANGSRKIYIINITRGTIDNNSSNNNTTEVCTLSSSVYSINNTNLTIDLVSQDASTETIRSNLSSNCGSIMVSNDKVILSATSGVKTYTIKRVFIPKTGQNTVKYALVIGGLVVILVVLFVIKKKSNK